MKHILIGTSGYSYKHWKGNFYPDDLPPNKWLSYYSEKFQTVELNVTYYRLPSEKMYQSWGSNTASDFVFSLKGSRYITHIKRLHEVEKGLGMFTQGAALLKPKAKVILWQFSPGFEKDLSRLEKFLELIKPLDYDQAFEFRHKSWFEPSTYNLLKGYNASFVFADSPEFPKTEYETADFFYIRFHGGRKLYGSAYSKAELNRWAETIKALEASRGYIYFNNDAFGFAPKNAKTLSDLLSSKDET